MKTILKISIVYLMSFFIYTANSYSLPISSNRNNVLFSKPYGIALNRAGTFILISNQGNNTITTCSYRESSIIDCHDSSASLLNHPAGLVFNESGTAVYIANSGNNFISKCDFTNDGLLNNCISNVGATGLKNPISIVLHNYNSNVRAFVVSKSNNAIINCLISQSGSMTNCANTNATLLDSPTSIAFNSNGSKAFITNLNSSNITQCNVNESGIFSNCINTGIKVSHPMNITINQSGTFAYISDDYNNLIVKCSLNDTSIYNCSNSGAGDLKGPVGAAVNLGNTRLISVNNFNDSLEQCDLSISNGQANSCQEFQAFHEFIYVTNEGSNSISMYKVDLLTGNLNELVGSPLSTPGRNPSSITLSVDGKYAFVGYHNDHFISTYSIETSSGRLELIATYNAGCCNQLLNVDQITTDPHGDYIYIAGKSAEDQAVDGLGEVVALSLNQANGALTAEGGYLTGTAKPNTVLAMQKSRIVYSTIDSGNDINTNSNLDYGRFVNGYFTNGMPLPKTGKSPSSLLLSKNEDFLYVTNAGDNNISQYMTNSSGMLTPLHIPTITTNINPSSIAIDPSGVFAYVTNYGSNNISTYFINEDGTLAFQNRDVSTKGTGPSKIIIDTTGAFAFVLNSTSNSIDVYQVNSSGLLSLLYPNVYTDKNPSTMVLWSGN